MRGGGRRPFKIYNPTFLFYFSYKPNGVVLAPRVHYCPSRVKLVNGDVNMI